MSTRSENQDVGKMYDDRRSDWEVAPSGKGAKEKRVCSCSPRGTLPR